MQDHSNEQKNNEGTGKFLLSEHQFKVVEMQVGFIRLEPLSYSSLCIVFSQVYIRDKDDMLL